MTSALQAVSAVNSVLLVCLTVRQDNQIEVGLGYMDEINATILIRIFLNINITIWKIYSQSLI